MIDIDKKIIDKIAKKVLRSLPLNEPTGPNISDGQSAIHNIKLKINIR
jgi:hypothetical protein